jgi:hypothetical protein
VNVVVRHRTSPEISETEIAIVEKCWRRGLIFGNRLDSNGKARPKRPAVIEKSHFFRRASINDKRAEECALTIAELGGGCG